MTDADDATVVFMVRAAGVGQWRWGRGGCWRWDEMAGVSEREKLGTAGFERDDFSLQVPSSAPHRAVDALGLVQPHGRREAWLGS